MADPDPSNILFLLEAFRRSKAMFAGVELGIFDRLEKAPADCDRLAKELAVSPGALEQLLDTCVGLQLLTRSDGQYANTAAASAYLCRSSPRQIIGYIRHSNLALWPMWGRLEDAVREGTNRWQQCFGSGGSLFSYFYRTEESRREFLQGMHGYGLISSPAVVAAFDLGRFRHLVDLGGGTGHLAVAACRRYPQLRATVFDLPSVLPLTREKIAEADISARVDVVAGNFFEDPLPGADLFAVGRILHDWDEEKIRVLLRKIRSALSSGGGLLIAEKLLHDDKRGPLWAQLQSLNMLVSTEGRERSLQEYTALLREAGFAGVEGRTTELPLDAVLALKP